MSEDSQASELLRLVSAFAHDPVYFRSNGPEDLPWQLALFEERLRFLVDVLQFRFKDMRRRALAGEFDVTALRYTGGRMRVEVHVFDRDCMLILRVGRRPAWLPWRRWIEADWVFRALTGREEVVSDAEALEVGRDGARRLYIDRITEFLRRELIPCLRGEDAEPLRSAAEQRRNYVRRWSDPQWRARQDLNEELKLEAAIGRTSEPFPVLLSDPADQQPLPRHAGDPTWRTTMLIGPLAGASLFMLISGLFRSITAISQGLHPRDRLPLAISWIGFLGLAALAVLAAKHAGRIERWPLTTWAALVAAASAIATAALAFTVAVP